MTRKFAFAALALVLAFAAHAQQQPPQPQQPRPPQYPQSQRAPQPGQQQSQPSQGAPTSPMASFGWFAELAGSCWKGTARAEGRSDVQCYQNQFSRFLRGSIKFYQNDKLTGEGDSVFAYDPNARFIVYSQWVSNGSIGFGQATLENGELIFHNRQPSGEEAPTRSVWRKVDADSFKVSRQRRSDQGAWTEESAVTYTRARGESPKG